MAAATLILGCANPGPPRPPSLHLPQIPGDLHAERIGNAVHLSWTTPAQTTDNLPIHGPLTAELCRTEPAQAPAPTPPPPRRRGHSAPIEPGLGPGAPPTPLPIASAPAISQPPVQCLWRLRLPVTPGTTTAVDPLSSPALTSDPPHLLAYTVRLENDSGHSASASSPSLAASGASPAAVVSLHLTPRPDGLRIEWQKSPGPGSVQLTRQQTGSTSPAVPRLAAKPVRNRVASPVNPPLPGRARAKAQQDTHLLASPEDRPDPGGSLDLTAPPGATLTYRAQRVRTVTVGGATLELHSEFSSPVTTTLSDIFPPGVPTGLVVIDASVPGAAPALPQSAVDLSWEPVADSDLAGYIVFRATVPAPPSARAAEWLSLNTDPITEPAFHDSTARPGVGYLYSVIAVDTQGNRSARSVEAPVTLAHP